MAALFVARSPNHVKSVWQGFILPAGGRSLLPSFSFSFGSVKVNLLRPQCQSKQSPFFPSLLPRRRKKLNTRQFPPLKREPSSSLPTKQAKIGEGERVERTRERASVGVWAKKALNKGQKSSGTFFFGSALASLRIRNISFFRSTLVSSGVGHVRVHFTTKAVSSFLLSTQQFRKTGNFGGRRRRRRRLSAAVRCKLPYKKADGKKKKAASNYAFGNPANQLEKCFLEGPQNIFSGSLSLKWKHSCDLHSHIRQKRLYSFSQAFPSFLLQPHFTPKKRNKTYPKFSPPRGKF